MTSNPESSVIPPDFPRVGRPGAVGGAHPKVLVRKVDGQLVTGPTEDETQARYALCVDLQAQLRPYCDRKQRENPDLDRIALLQKIRAGVGQKGWDLSEAELDWIMKRLGLSAGAELRELVPWQVAPSWMEEFLAKATSDAPLKHGQMQTLLKGCSRVSDQK